VKTVTELARHSHDQSPLVVISAGHAAAAEATAELNLEAGEPKLQCLPSGRGTTAFTNDHDGVAIAAGDAAAAEAVGDVAALASASLALTLPT
jgi:hypothetical protein